MGTRSDLGANNATNCRPHIHSNCAKKKSKKTEKMSTEELNYYNAVLYQLHHLKGRIEITPDIDTVLDDMRQGRTPEECCQLFIEEYN